MNLKNWSSRDDNPRICSPSERESVLRRDKSTCRYCGNRKPPFHIDHVYPYSRGGITSVENLVTSCQRCNQKKHNSIGLWPKPIGYFDTNFSFPYLALSFLLFGTASTANGFLTILKFSIFTKVGMEFILLGIVLNLIGIGCIIKGK